MSWPLRKLFYMHIIRIIRFVYGHILKFIAVRRFSFLCLMSMNPNIGNIPFQKFDNIILFRFLMLNLVENARKEVKTNKNNNTIGKYIIYYNIEERM